MTVATTLAPAADATAMAETTGTTEIGTTKAVVAMGVRLAGLGTIFEATAETLREIGGADPGDLGVFCFCWVMPTTTTWCRMWFNGAMSSARVPERTGVPADHQWNRIDVVGRIRRPLLF